jgi:hypothetical protein
MKEGESRWSRGADISMHALRNVREGWALQCCLHKREQKTRPTARCPEECGDAGTHTFAENANRWGTRLPDLVVSRSFAPKSHTIPLP